MGARSDRPALVGLRADSGRVFVIRAVLWLVLGVSSLLVGLAGCLAVASAVRQPALVLTTGCLTATTIWMLGVSLVRRRRAARASPRGGVAASVVAVVALGALIAGLLVPLGDPRVEAAAPAGAGR